MKDPKFVSINYDYKPLPRVRISDDYDNWTVVEDPQEALDYLQDKHDFKKYYDCYKTWLDSGRPQSQKEQEQQQTL